MDGTNGKPATEKRQADCLMCRCVHMLIYTKNPCIVLITKKVLGNIAFIGRWMFMILNKPQVEIDSTF